MSDKAEHSSIRALAARVWLYTGIYDTGPHLVGFRTDEIVRCVLRSHESVSAEIGIRGQRMGMDCLWRGVHLQFLCGRTA